MAGFFFDTSAIVKRYHKEVGSEVVDRMFESKGHGLAISFWTVLEFIVAFSAMRKRRELSEAAFRSTVARFLKDVTDRFTVTSVDDELVASALSVANKHALPSADCLQLASALDLQRALREAGERFTLVSSDSDMCRVAKEGGIDFINPEEKDALDKLLSSIT